NNRGSAWIAKKEYDKAIKDFCQAIRLDPKSAPAHFGCSLGKMLMNRQDAAAGFRDFLELLEWKGELSLYAALLGHFAARQSEDEAGATRLLKDGFGKLDEAIWPYPVVKFLRNEIDETALLKLATDDNKRTVVHCFLGLDKKLKRHRE